MGFFGRYSVCADYPIPTLRPMPITGQLRPNGPSRGLMPEYQVIYLSDDQIEPGSHLVYHGGRVDHTPVPFKHIASE
jgi:hypothetical protein